MNGEGLQTRYENPDEIIAQIIAEPVESVVPLIQKLYRETVKPELIARRVKAIKNGGRHRRAFLHALWARATRISPLKPAWDAVCIATTVTTTEFRSSKGTSIDLERFCKEAKVPVIVGNASLIRA